jgi:hypothetical protein
MSPNRKALVASMVCILTAVAGAQSGYMNSGLPGTFVDISTTGGMPIPGVGDNSVHMIMTTVGNVMFPAGPVVISNNGVAISGLTSASISFANTHVGFAGAPGVSSLGSGYVFPFWDDLRPSSIPSDTTLWWQEVGNVLYIMWKNETLSDFPDPAQVVTFEVQVFANPPGCSPAVQFLYPDSVFGGSGAGHDNGGSATAALVSWNAIMSASFEFGVDTPNVSPGTVISFGAPVSTLAASSPGGPGTASLMFNLTPNCGVDPDPDGSWILAVTQHMGAYPSGWLGGVDMPISELLNEVSLGPPFVGEGGFFQLSVSNAPPLTFYAVVLHFYESGPMDARSNAIGYSIP